MTQNKEACRGRFGSEDGKASELPLDAVSVGEGARQRVGQVIRQIPLLVPLRGGGRAGASGKPNDFRRNIQEYRYLSIGSTR